MPVFIAMAAAAAAAHHYSKQLVSEEAASVDPSILQGLTSIDLLPSELRFIEQQPIQTIAFYEGNPSNAAAILWDRLNEIVQKNPWLGGCLAKGGKGEDYDTDNTPIRIWYDKSPSSLHPGMFQLLPRGLVHLGRTTSYTDLENRFHACSVSVKANSDILNNTQEALFKVSIIPEHLCSDASSDDGFTLVVSMSNVFGDDYTFFRIYDMLIGSDIIPLNPTRVQEFDVGVKNLMGTVESTYVEHITADSSWEKFFINDELEQTADIQGILFEVKSEWLMDMKKTKLQHERTSGENQSLHCIFKSPLDDLIIKNHKGNVINRVTCGNIIASWFWNLVRPDVGLMEVNLREHVEGTNANHAGNYTNSIAYTPVDYKTAEKVQKSIDAVCRISKRFDPPTILPRMRVNTRFSIVSNHLHFTRPKTETSYNGDGVHLATLNDEKFKLVRHLPLHFGDALKGVLPKRMSFLDLFCISDDRAGCFVVAPADVIKKIKICGIVQETIYSF